MNRHDRNVLLVLQCEHVFGKRSNGKGGQVARVVGVWEDDMLWVWSSGCGKYKTISFVYSMIAHLPAELSVGRVVSSVWERRSRKQYCRRVTVFCGRRA